MFILGNRENAADGKVPLPLSNRKSVELIPAAYRQGPAAVDKISGKIA